MRTLRNLGCYPAGRPLAAEDVVEFHAARLLLLIDTCGSQGRIEGLTKLAKMDFFVRYPQFFARACADAGLPTNDGSGEQVTSEAKEPFVESPMVRYHYGPWDRRYYHVLAYLESRQLLEVQRGRGRRFHFVLTAQGRTAATSLATAEPFLALRRRMIEVDSLLGGRDGAQLKALVYRLFDREVVARRMGELISQ